MPDRLVALIGYPQQDPLVAALCEQLARDGWEVLLVAPDALGRTPIGVGDTVTVHGRRIQAVVNRCTPASRVAAGFAAADADFAEAETRATLLAILTHRTVKAVNPSDVDTWFALAEWPVWLGRCARAGVPTVPLTVGGVDRRSLPANGRSLPANEHWLTWSGQLARVPEPAARAAMACAVIPVASVRQLVWCCGTVVEGAASAAVHGAGQVLHAHGVLLAGIAVDHHDRIVSITTMPAVTESAASHAAALVAKALR
jgi:hypothetical protein